MEEPLTEELLQQLLAAPTIQAAVDIASPARDLPSYLQQLLDEKGLVRPAVIKEAGLNETFGYQIFMGTRHASRDKLLQLIFAMSCTVKEANRILNAAGASALYCKTRRDAIIIFCLDNGMSLLRTNEELYRFNEAIIG